MGRASRLISRMVLTMAINKKLEQNSLLPIFALLSIGCSTAPGNATYVKPERIEADELKNVTPLDWNPMTVTYQSVDRLHDECYEAIECANLITSVIYRNWTRPPVRTGSPASFLITLDKNNNIVGLRLIESNGDFRFDKSAAVAIMSSSPFDELKSLDNVERERYLQTFEVKFHRNELR